MDLLEAGLVQGTIDPAGDQAAAYLGEVMIRWGAGGHWAPGPGWWRHRADHPVVRWSIDGDQCSDPYAFLQRYASAREPGDTLRECVTTLATYVADPTEETFQRLGLTVRRQHESVVGALRRWLRSRHEA